MKAERTITRDTDIGDVNYLYTAKVVIETAYIPASWDSPQEWHDNSYAEILEPNNLSEEIRVQLEQDAIEYVMEDLIAEEESYA